MEPQHLRFGGGVGATVLHPLVALAVLLAGLLILFLPRHRAVMPFLAAAILIPEDQILLVGGLHFPMLRIVALFGMIRLLWTTSSSKTRLFRGGINKIDLAVILLATSTAIAGVLLFRQAAAIVYQTGALYEALGIYLTLRFLIRDEADIDRALKTLAYIAAVVGVVMAIEQVTGSNPYAMLGGARASVYQTVMERGDRFRATGCFGHPILAGTFGAVLPPLFIGLWLKDKKNRTTAIVGLAGATVMMITSASSTPIMGYFAGLFALCLWPVRGMMRLFRWGIVATLVSLHMVMKAPVWNLIARVDVVGGSSAEHRYQLVNQFIRRFSEWWLFGTQSSGTWGWGMWDTANQYVAVGVAGGLLAFVLFLTAIVQSFKFVGKARRIAHTKKLQLFFWALGAALFANVVSFFGISYFDQTMVGWYTLLAAISAAVLIPQPKPVAAAAAVDSADALSPLAFPVSFAGAEGESVACDFGADSATSGPYPVTF